MVTSKLLVLLTCAGSVAGCGAAIASPLAAAYDPGERVNRHIFGFNQAVDRHFLGPVARSYTRVPQPVRKVVRNFLLNLSEPEIFVNDVLQLKASRAGVTAARFGFNSTIGLAGLLDVARRWSLRHHDGDFGQTLGRWGVPPGAAIQLPILGPSSLRDTVGLVVGRFLNPVGYITGVGVTPTRIGLGATRVADGRAQLLPVTDKLQVESSDYYATLRDLQAKRRRELVAEAQSGAVEPRRLDATPPLAIPDLTAPEALPIPLEAPAGTQKVAPHD